MGACFNRDLPKKIHDICTACSLYGVRYICLLFAQMLQLAAFARAFLTKHGPKKMFPDHAALCVSCLAGWVFQKPHPTFTLQTAQISCFLGYMVNGP